MRIGTSTPRRDARRASFLTHVAFTEFADHSTTAHLQVHSSRSIITSNASPGLILRSHHTRQPRAVSILASALAAARSSRAQLMKVAETTSWIWLSFGSPRGGAG